MFVSSLSSNGASAPALKVWWEDGVTGLACPHTAGTGDAKSPSLLQRDQERFLRSTVWLSVSHPPPRARLLPLSPLMRSGGQCQYCCFSLGSGGKNNRCLPKHPRCPNPAGNYFSSLWLTLLSTFGTKKAIEPGAGQPFCPSWSFNSFLEYCLDLILGAEVRMHLNQCWAHLQWVSRWRTHGMIQWWKCNSSPKEKRWYC